MHHFVRHPFVPVVALLLAASAQAQTFVFKGGERWEINDPLKMDTAEARHPRPQEGYHQRR
jgi:hypothetical protein